MKFFAVMLVSILVLIFIISVSSYPVKEKFHSTNSYFKNYCPSCGWRSRYSCSKCTNCGYCINSDGNGECVPGDSNGPYFKEDCKYWEYSDPYIYYPYSHLYPNIRTRTHYPHYRYGYIKPRHWVKK